MKLAYVAGPYRSKDGIWGVKRNIETATAVARELWLMGYAVICPHANTAFMDGNGTDHVFLNGDLEILRRCDLIIMLPGWLKSAGARAEWALALDRKMPVFIWTRCGDRERLAQWAKEEARA